MLATHETKGQRLERKLVDEAEEVRLGRITYYVIVSFRMTEDGPVPDEPRELPNAAAARTAAAALKSEKAGVIAFSRSGDPATGEFEDAVILAQHGEMPDEVREWLTEV